MSAQTITGADHTADEARALTLALRSFDITATVEDVTRGATVDRYHLAPGAGVKVKQIAALADDLAIALEVASVRVLPVGKHIAVEVPAAQRRTVTLDEVADHIRQTHPLEVPIGVSVEGEAVAARLDHLPHLVVSGTTGSGKSVALTSMLAHLVAHATPGQVGLVLVDPKRVELAAFRPVPHLLRPVATDVDAAVRVLADVEATMDERYRALEQAGVRNISELGAEAPPYVVVAVDELADLIMQAQKRVEPTLVRLLQLGRAAGIHLILATQRPSADVLTGLIRANTPSRLAFSVRSYVDSNVALGQSGAERLLGQGDALWWPSGAREPERVQAPFLSTDDLTNMMADVADHLPDDQPYDEPVAVDESVMPERPEPMDAPAASIRDDEPAALSWADIDGAIRAAYDKGRSHGNLLAHPPMREHRAMVASDWSVAVLVTLMVGTFSVVALPLLPIVVGVGAAYAVTRHRTSMAKYRASRERMRS
ncbi:DNA translocase FtsK [Georgenia deserti]|uniref:DNA translocase FtsK n=1 Tax=Georgenia deserti TaxID=2093781 RepID=A0ABW4L1M5_9MICO